MGDAAVCSTGFRRRGSHGRAEGGFFGDWGRRKRKHLFRFQLSSKQGSTCSSSTVAGGGSSSRTDVSHPLTSTFPSRSLPLSWSSHPKRRNLPQDMSQALQ